MERFQRILSARDLGPSGLTVTTPFLDFLRQEMTTEEDQQSTIHPGLNLLIPACDNSLIQLFIFGLQPVPRRYPRVEHVIKEGFFDWKQRSNAEPGDIIEFEWSAGLKPKVLYVHRFTVEEVEVAEFMVRTSVRRQRSKRIKREFDKHAYLGTVGQAALIAGGAVPQKVGHQRTYKDGEWEAPKFENPKCEAARGCAPLIDNPKYKGIWKPRDIPNPNCSVLLTSDFEPIAAVGFKIWTMKDGILSDNTSSSAVEAVQDWDDEEDGAWEAPQSEISESNAAPGRGGWEKPMKRNPAHNPTYFKLSAPDSKPITVEMWTMKGGILSDNTLIAGEEKTAESYRKTPWKPKFQQKAAEASAGRSGAVFIQVSKSKGPRLALGGLTEQLSITATKSEDWDGEEDGEWEAPKFENPKCEAAPGCAPLMDNPKYKGCFVLLTSDFEPFAAVGFKIWTMKDGILSDNTSSSAGEAVRDWDDEEDGAWEAPQSEISEVLCGGWEKPMKRNPAHNPTFFELSAPDSKPITVEMWTMKGGILSDNTLIAGEEKTAESYRKTPWKPKFQQKAAEASAGRSDAVFIQVAEEGCGDSM